MSPAPRRPQRWAVFLSGRGSNASALFEMMSEVDIHLCVSSKKSALGLCRAQREGIPTLVLDKSPDWKQLDLALNKYQVTHIFLLGFMKILPPEFVALWKGRIFNLHPSLLPTFPGKDSIQESYEAGAAMGVTIHEVTAEMDAGPRLLQFVSRETASEKKHQVPQAEAQMEISRTEQRLVREALQILTRRWEVVNRRQA